MIYCIAFLSCLIFWEQRWCSGQAPCLRIPGLAATIAKIGYLLLPSRIMTNMSLKRRKTSKQPTSLLVNLHLIWSYFLSSVGVTVTVHQFNCISHLLKWTCDLPQLQQEKKEEIWLSPMTKAPTPTEMSKGQSDNTNNATKKFDYTAVADRLRTVSWSNYSHPTGVVNRFTGPPSH